MPNLDGYRAPLSCGRPSTASDHTPIIAHDRPRDATATASDGRAAGMDDCLAKPMRHNRSPDLLRRWIGPETKNTAPENRRSAVAPRWARKTNPKPADNQATQPRTVAGTAASKTQRPECRSRRDSGCAPVSDLARATARPTGRHPRCGSTRGPPRGPRPLGFRVAEPIKQADGMRSRSRPTPPITKNHDRRHRQLSGAPHARDEAAAEAAHEPPDVCRSFAHQIPYRSARRLTPPISDKRGGPAPR